MKYTAWVLIIFTLFIFSSNNVLAQATSGQCNQTLAQPNSTPPQFQWTCSTNGISFGASADNVARDDCLNGCPLGSGGANQQLPGSQGPNQQLPGSQGPNQPLPGSGAITNPIQSSTFGQLMQKIALAAAQIGLPLVTVFIIYSGFLFVSARGNEEQLTKAKTTFFWAVIGAMLVVGAFAIATAIKNFAGQL